MTSGSLSRPLRGNFTGLYRSGAETVLRFFSDDSISPESARQGGDGDQKGLKKGKADSNLDPSEKKSSQSQDGTTLWQQWSGGGLPPQNSKPRTGPKFTPKDPNKDWKSLSRAQRSVQDRIAAILVPEDGTASHPSGRYGILGTATDAPRHVPGASTRAEEISPKRLLPHRLFYPGATYSPEELDPYKAKPVTMLSDLVVKRGSIQPRVVESSNDFRNPNFLNNFISESGKINPRRQTRLPAKMHRTVVRQIKFARSLALMCPTSRVHLQSPGDRQDRRGGDANSQSGRRQRREAN